MATSSKSAGTGVLSGSKAKTGSEHATLRGGIRRSASRTTASEQFVVVRETPSFISRTETKRGRIVSFNYFDVPDEEFCKGLCTGIKAASDLLFALERGDFSATLHQVFADVGVALKEDGDSPSRYGAASGFVDIIGSMLIAASRRIEHFNWSRTHLESARKNERFISEWKAKKRQQFIERMKAAKAAKREAGHA